VTPSTWCADCTRPRGRRVCVTEGIGFGSTGELDVARADAARKAALRDEVMAAWAARVAASKPGWGGWSSGWETAGSTS
jgi:hypothetical protein